MRQVKRDGAAINLRCVDRPVIDPALRDRESLLSAAITVATADEIKQLFLEFQSAGVEFFQTLKREPWGARTFIIKDPDGNLLAVRRPGGLTPRAFWTRAVCAHNRCASPSPERGGSAKHRSEAHASRGRGDLATIVPPHPALASLGDAPPPGEGDPNARPAPVRLLLEPIDEPPQQPRPDFVLADRILDAVFEVGVVVDLHHDEAAGRSA